MKASPRLDQQTRRTGGRDRPGSSLPRSYFIEGSAWELELPASDFGMSGPFGSGAAAPVAAGAGGGAMGSAFSPQAGMIPSNMAAAHNRRFLDRGMRSPLCRLSDKTQRSVPLLLAVTQSWFDLSPDQCSSLIERRHAKVGAILQQSGEKTGGWAPRIREDRLPLGQTALEP